MKVYEAVTEPTLEEYCKNGNIKAFLAGGITNCNDWQSAVIDKLSDYDLPDLLLFNPRRKTFDITKTEETEKQIEWEFKHLNDMDLFLMYFANSKKNNQPICMYELGRNLERMKHRFPYDWKHRIIIGVEDGYCRTKDVLVQTKLATYNDIAPITGVTPEEFAMYVRNAVIYLRYE